MFVIVNNDYCDDHYLFCTSEETLMVIYYSYEDHSFICETWTGLMIWFGICTLSLRSTHDLCLKNFVFCPSVTIYALIRQCPIKFFSAQTICIYCKHSSNIFVYRQLFLHIIHRNLCAITVCGFAKLYYEVFLLNILNV